jgi:hypothetical protein
MTASQHRAPAFKKSPIGGAAHQTLMGAYSDQNHLLDFMQRIFDFVDVHQITPIACPHPVARAYACCN